MNYTDLLNITYDENARAVAQISEVSPFAYTHCQLYKLAETLLHDHNETVLSGHSGEQGMAHLCGHWPTRFGNIYGGVHGIVALSVCLFGSLLNLMSLTVLTRPKMQNPTNTILSGLAFADFLNQLEYMPFALFMKALARPGFPLKTYPWALLVLGHSNISQVCHTSSICLTVSLAVWRYLIVSKPMRSKTLCTSGRAKWTVSLAYVCSFLICIPVFLIFSIMETDAMWNGGEVEYYVYYSELALLHDQRLVRANFLIYSVVIKLIPCVLLTIVSVCLVKSLTKTSRRKKALLVGHKRSRHGEIGGSGDRTTGMLLAILLLFLMSELPQGILGLLCLIFGDEFFHDCYLPLGDLMDIIALSNAAAHSILYATMSHKFRQIFLETFGMHRICAKKSKSSAKSVEAEGATAIELPVLAAKQHL